MFAVSPMLEFCTKTKTLLSSVFSVCGFAHSALQFSCVWSVDTCAYIKLMHFPSLPSSAHSIFTALWCSSVVKLNTYIPSPGPILALPSIARLTHLSQSHQGIENLDSTISEVLLTCVKSASSRRQVCEHPDSTISKVLTVIKWRIIIMLNRKLLEKQRYRTALLPMRYT